MSQTITANKPRRIKPTTLAAIGFAAPLIIYMLIFYVWPLIQNIWPFAVWCGWVCQVVTVLRSSLPQVR